MYTLRQMTQIRHPVQIVMSRVKNAQNTTRKAGGKRMGWATKQKEGSVGLGTLGEVLKLKNAVWGSR